MMMMMMIANLRVRLQGWIMLLLFGQLFVGTAIASSQIIAGRNLLEEPEIASMSDGGAFTSDNSYRQDFCPRYKEMVSNGRKINVKNALSGEELHVSLVPGKYFIYNEETGIDPDYPGLNALMLDYIAEQGNFTWRNSFGVWTREQKVNRSVTELLEWGTDKYDIMAGEFTPSTTRMNLGVSFVDGHFDGSLIMIRNVKPTTTGVNWTNWKAPFENEVWIVIIAVVIFSSFVYQLIEHLGGRREEDVSFRSWLMKNLYLSFINLTGNYSYEPTTLGGRVFGFFFAFWAMLITGTYVVYYSVLYLVRLFLIFSGTCFDSIRFDSIQFDSIRFDSINLIYTHSHLHLLYCTPLCFKPLTPQI